MSNDWLDEFIKEVFADNTTDWIDVTPLEGLLKTSSFEGRDFDDLWYQIIAIDRMDEYKDILKKLLDNQTDPILSGRNYGHKQIMEHLKKLR